MRRQSSHAQARARVLSDGELRAIWTAAESSGTFGAFIRAALLTAQRRAKVLAMRWADISDDGEWTIPKLPREKDSAAILALPPQTLDIIRALPHLGDNPYVFAGRGDGPINGISKCKSRLDGKLPPGTPKWTIHDLRRTARSLMARAGVASEHAERVMGHAIAGVQGIYDRHAYHGEKTAAVARLAALIDGIVHPHENVLAMGRPR